MAFQGLTRKKFSNRLSLTAERWAPGAGRKISSERKGEERKGKRKNHGRR